MPITIQSRFANLVKVLERQSRHSRVRAFSSRQSDVKNRKNRLSNSLKSGTAISADVGTVHVPYFTWKMQSFFFGDGKSMRGLMRVGVL